MKMNERGRVVQPGRWTGILTQAVLAALPLLGGYAALAFAQIGTGQSCIGQESFVQPVLVQESPPQPIGAEGKADSQADNDQATAEFDLDSNLKSFDQVWETIANTLWDEQLVAEKWNPLKAKYRPQVEVAESIDQVRETIQTMINELNLSHFGIIQSSAIDVISPTEESGDAYAGLWFRWVDDEVVVSQVEQGSSAAEAGVEPGWIVEKIGDLEVSEVVERIRSAAHGPIRLETLVGLTLSELSSGPSEQKKPFRFVDRNAEPQEMSLELRVPAGKFTKFGHLPPIRVQTRVVTLPERIGYFWFNAFLDPVRLMPQFRECVHQAEHSGGMILDLRGNMGGMAGMTMGMASEFSDTDASLGIMTMKGAEIKFFVSACAEPVTCPVAVLVDECSISSAEILAGGLQDLKLARIFGSRTAGLALPSVVVRLPNGDGFQYAMANYHSASGKSLEMNGVSPDETVVLSRELLLADPDPVLSRAVQWIQQQNVQKNP